MTTALQEKVAAAALARMAQQATNAAQPPAKFESKTKSAESELAAPQNTRTFVHLVAGANTILPDGRKLVFGGKRGGLGYYVTGDADEIEWLADLARSATSQVTEEVADKVVAKKADPAVELAHEDAQRNSALVMNPQAASVVENIAAHIAAGSAADGNR